VAEFFTMRALADPSGEVALLGLNSRTSLWLSSEDNAVTTAALVQMSTEQLMDAYVAGSGEAFDLLYQRAAPKLFGYLLRLTRNRAQAEDLLQVTFSKIHRARASYLQGAPFLPWASAIARRSFYDDVRWARARHEALSPDGQLPDRPAPAEAPPSDAQDALEQALGELPVKYREAIQLTKIVGLSLQEAAAVLATTPTAVKLRVHRGYLALRQALSGAVQPEAQEQDFDPKPSAGGAES
jgi:RNA polymerase sigma-70 factor, ECF subfamily